MLLRKVTVLVVFYMLGTVSARKICVAVVQHPAGSESCWILQSSHHVYTSPSARSIAKTSSECATGKQRLTQLVTSDVLISVTSKCFSGTEFSTGLININSHDLQKK